MLAIVKEQPVYAAAVIALLTIAAFGPRISAKGLLLGIASLYKSACVWWLWVQGSSPQKESERRVVSGQAWDEFCDSLKAAGAVLKLPGTPQDPLTQAEGVRYLSRLTRAALENFLECGDVANPKLVALADGMRDSPVKLGSDNPDNLYLSAQISSDFSYLLTGTVGEASCFQVGLQKGSYGAPGGLETLDSRDKGALNMSQDGSICVIIRPQMGGFGSPGGGGFRAVPGTDEMCMVGGEGGKGLPHMLLVRQTFADRLTQTPANLTLRRLGGGGGGGEIQAERVDLALGKASLFVGGASAMFSVWAKEFQAHTNELPLFDQAKSNKAGGDPNIRYYHSYWSLRPNQALIITVNPPECDYWNFQLNNHWMESLEYRQRERVHINNTRAKLHPNSTKGVVIVVCGERPDDKVYAKVNWIDTCGHEVGTMCFRWVKPTSDPCPQPSCMVVATETLPDCV